MDSFIGWVGGKKLLRNAICDRFPNDIGKYVEVFGGAGWVLFHRDKHADFEVYNDINGNLVNLFRCIKYHADAVLDEMSLLLNSREIFNCFKNQDICGLTDIQRAARYLYLVKASYGCKVKTYGAKPRKACQMENFKHIQKRLERVVIENKSFEALIQQYDRKDTLFYCDPPYYGTEGMYETGDFIFDEGRHIALKEFLAGIKGKFILSYNDCEFIRRLYDGFFIEEVARSNSLAVRHGEGKVYNELIIRNY